MTIFVLSYLFVKTNIVLTNKVNILFVKTMFVLTDIVYDDSWMWWNRFSELDLDSEPLVLVGARGKQSSHSIEDFRSRLNLPSFDSTLRLWRLLLGSGPQSIFSSMILQLLSGPAPALTTGGGRFSFCTFLCLWGPNGGGATGVFRRLLSGFTGNNHEFEVSVWGVDGCLEALNQSSLSPEQHRESSRYVSVWSRCRSIPA